VKVLIVTPSYLPIIGGSETLTRILATKLNKFGVHTDVMAFNMNKKWKTVLGEKIEHSNFSVFKVAAINPVPFLPVNPLYNLLRVNVFPSLGFRKRFEDYDVIHFLGEADLTMPLLSLSVKKPKIMHCVAVPSLEEEFRRHRTMKKLFEQFFRRLADVYFVFSSAEEKTIMDMGVPSSRIRILRYGVDTDVFRPDESKRLSNLVLFVGRIEEIKGLHVLLNSLRYVNVETRVVIIGPAGKRDYFDQISEMCLEINRGGVHHVEYLGSKDQDDLVLWYQKATVLVRPDLVGASGEGCSTMEALACGTPVIGVQNHVVKNDVNGLIVTPNNPKELAEALNKVLADKKLRGEFGIAARKTMEQQFSVNSSVLKLINIYKELLNQGENPFVYPLRMD
jgi:glycosyltransferase involved in cell wall biosynthesis